MTDDPQIIAWIPKTGDDTKPGESFAVFAQQTPPWPILLPSPRRRYFGDAQ